MTGAFSVLGRTLLVGGPLVFDSVLFAELFEPGEVALLAKEPIDIGENIARSQRLGQLVGVLDVEGVPVLVILVVEELHRQVSDVVPGEDELAVLHGASQSEEGVFELDPKDTDVR